MIVNEAVSNAIKYAYDDFNGTINVTLLRKGGKCMLHIQDFGKGYDPVMLRDETLIETLAIHYNQIVGYDTIIDEVWPDGVLVDSSLRTLVYSIRQILPELPIESHSKMGYILRTTNTEA